MQERLVSTLRSVTPQKPDGRGPLNETSIRAALKNYHSQGLVSVNGRKRIIDHLLLKVKPSIEATWGISVS